MIIQNLELYSSSEIERFFLAAKDLLDTMDSKTQSILQKFIIHSLKLFPELLELQGNRIFKAILRSRTPAISKLDVIIFNNKL